MPGIARDHQHGNDAIPAELTLTSLTTTGDLTVGDDLVVTDDITCDQITANTGTFDAATVQAGTQTSNLAAVGGRIAVDVTAAGTGANTTETVLATHTVKGGSLVTSGDAIKVRAVFTCAATGDDKTPRLRWGGLAGTLVAGGFTDAFNTTIIYCEATIARTGAATQVSFGTQEPNATAQTIQWRLATPALTLANDNDVVATGQNGASTANDIQCLYFDVEYLRAPA